jgi:translocation and assembly module TamA
MNVPLILFTMLIAGLTFQTSNQHFFCDSTVIYSTDTGNATEYPKNTISQAIATHLSYLSDMGYFSAVVDSVNACLNSDITHGKIFLRQGPRFIIRRLQIYTDGELSHDVEVNDFFTNAIVETKITSILDSLRQAGYPFADGVVTGLFADTLIAEISPKIEISSGEKVFIADMNFSGLQQISASYLKQVINFKVGELYNPDKANLYQQRLLSNIFLVDVGEPELVGINDVWYYNYRIEEVRPGSGDLVIGYNPSSGAGNGIVGRAELRLDNLISLGSRAELLFEKLPDLETRLNAAYTQYWIGRIPIELKIRGNFHQSDSSFITRGIVFQASYHLSEQSRVGWSASSRFTDVDERNVDLTVSDSRSVMVSLEYGFQNTDRRLNPRSGQSFIVKLGSGARHVNSLHEISTITDTRLSFIQFESILKAYFSLRQNQVLVPSVNAFYKTMDFFFRDDLMPLGGALSFRGYNEEQFLVSQAFWADLEYRYLLDRFSYLFVFGAAGNVIFPEIPGIAGADNISNRLVSGGFGLAYRVRIGMLSFTYAISEDTVLSNGKVHFGISSTF